MVCPRVCVAVVLVALLKSASAAGCRGDNVKWDLTSKPPKAVIPSDCGDLFLRNANVRDVGFRAISDMISTKGKALQITMLDLSYNKLTDAPLRDFLVAMEKNYGIQDLGLNHNKFTAAGAKFIADALPKLNVKRIFLGGNHFKDEGIATIAKGLAGYKGRNFAMQESEMTGVGLKALGEGVKNNPHLEQFVALDNKNIGGAAVADLLNILRAGDNKINHVQLERCGVTEADGAAILEAVKASPRIRHLDVAGDHAFERSQVYADIRSAVSKNAEAPADSKKVVHDEM